MKNIRVRIGLLLIAAICMSNGLVAQYNMKVVMPSCSGASTDYIKIYKEFSENRVIENVSADPIWVYALYTQGEVVMGQGGYLQPGSKMEVSAELASKGMRVIISGNNTVARYDQSCFCEYHKLKREMCLELCAISACDDNKVEKCKELPRSCK